MATLKQVFSLCLWVALLTGCGTSAAESEVTLNGVTFGEMTTFIAADAEVRHMEVDLAIPGNILFTDGHSMKTTNGQKTSVILGSAKEEGYKEAIGGDARFITINSFVQLNKTTVVMVDQGNQCLRLLDRPSGLTSPFVGVCGTNNTGYQDGQKPKFAAPYMIIKDVTQPGRILLTDQYNDMVRAIDINTREVSTFITAGLSLPRGIAFDIERRNLIISNSHYLIEVPLSDTSAGKRLSGIEVRGSEDGDIKTARYYFPQEILALSSDVFLVPDQGYNRIRIINKMTRSVATVCDGKRATTDGSVTSCQLNWPRSIFRSGDYVYIGTRLAIRRIKVERLQKRLDFEVDYDIKCSDIRGNALEVLKASATQKYNDIETICAGVCKRSGEERPSVACRDDVVTIAWPTDKYFSGKVTAVPADLMGKMSAVGKSMLDVIVSTRIPPLAYPKVNAGGLPYRFKLAALCTDGLTYQRATDTCQQ